MATTTGKTFHEEPTADSMFSKTAVNLRSAASLLCAVSYSVSSAFAAEFMALSSQAGMPGLQLIFLAKLVQFLFCLIVLPCFRPKLTAEDTQQTMILFLLAVIDNMATILAFMSFVYVVPGIAFGIIQGSVPLFTACIGFVFLRETVGVMDFCGILCSAVGVIIVAVGMSMGTASSTQWLTVAILLPLAAAFTKGPDNVIIRLLIGLQDMSILTVMTYTQLLGTVLLLVLTYIFETPRWTMSTRTMGYVIGLCLCDLYSSLSVKLVFKMEKAGVTATLLSLTIPFTILLDYIFQSKFPSPVILAGVSLVVLGIAVIGGHTWWVHRQEMRHRELMEKLYLDG